MNTETYNALIASIEKWERNTEAERWKEYTTGTDTCPLCSLFHRKDCDGCPVAENTGWNFCMKTPHSLAFKARQRWSAGNPKGQKLAHEAARKEVLFLQSLVPAGGPDE